MAPSTWYEAVADPKRKFEGKHLVEELLLEDPEVSVAAVLPGEVLELTTEPVFVAVASPQVSLAAARAALQQNTAPTIRSPK